MTSGLSEAQKQELVDIASVILAPGKGILAADESTGEISSISFNREFPRKRQSSLLIIRREHRLSIPDYET